MTSFQKVIKYGAIALAIYLCFIIIGMIVFSITAIFGVTAGLEIFENNKDNVAMITKWEQEYSNITNMDIDLNVCKLNIKKGDTLKVDVLDVSNQFKCKAEGNKLKIEDKNLRKNIFNREDIKPEVTIYIPENIEFEEITIETGVNETNIESIKADRINLEMGVGKYQVDTISAKYVKIDAGAGEAIINNANIEELKLDGGVGKLVLGSKISKKADISSGVGRMELNLIGLPTAYRIKAETGLGNFVVNGQKVTENQTLGNGDATIKIDAGVGETVVNFQETTTNNI